MKRFQLAWAIFLLSIMADAPAQRETTMSDAAAINAKIHSYLQPISPGLQYVVCNHQGVILAFAGGLADIQQGMAVTEHTTMSAFSMTKVLTAIAILQLVDAGKLALDEPISPYLAHPYDPRITIRQLLAHTSGIPNPLPLRWVHLANQRTVFNERAALQEVLAKHSRTSHTPGRKYLYSNIGYWLLGQIIEQASGKTYAAYVKQHVFQPLRIEPEELDFVIVQPASHAHGYLEKYSLMNLAKSFLLDDFVWGEYEDNWLRINDVHLNGASFGGAIGTALAFSRILQDLLAEHSVILSDASKTILFQQSKTNSNVNIDMTLGWHIGTSAGTRYFYKEGGGAGFHSEMRVYPSKGIGTVVMANQTSFDSTRFLNTLDVEFLK